MFFENPGGDPNNDRRLHSLGAANGNVFIPEPGSALLLVLGGMLTLIIRRWRR